MFVAREEAEIKVIPMTDEDWRDGTGSATRFVPKVRVATLTAHSEGADMTMTPIEARRLIVLLTRGINRSAVMAYRKNEKLKAKRAAKKAKKK